MSFIRAQWDRALGWALIVLGGVAILLGYEGIRESPFVAEQLAYLASGGVGGLWLVGVGSTLLVTANLGDEWRKLDEVKELITRVLELEEPDSAPARADEMATVRRRRVRQLRAAGRVVATRHSDTGSANLAGIAVTGGSVAFVSLLVVIIGWVRAEQAGTAGDAFAAVGLGAIGLPILGVSAAVLVIRFRDDLRDRAGAMFAPFALVAESLALDEQAGGAPQAGWVRVRGSDWAHRAHCPMAAGRDVEPVDEGHAAVAPCPLCRP